MKLPETVRAAFVIARRDFSATVLSKTFLFFLLGPLFPLAIGLGFVGIGARESRAYGRRRNHKRNKKRHKFLEIHFFQILLKPYKNSIM